MGDHPNLDEFDPSYDADVESVDDDFEDVGHHVGNTYLHEKAPQDLVEQALSNRALHRNREDQYATHQHLTGVQPPGLQDTKPPNMGSSLLGNVEEMHERDVGLMAELAALASRMTKLIPD